MKRTVSILLVMLMTLAMLAGCAEEIPVTPTEPQPSESLVWETMPKLTYGVMEYEKLEVLPWSSGRAEATGSYRWAETAQGYYRLNTENMVLTYADKADLQNWVPVCSKPNCGHTAGTLTCDAIVRYGTFLIREGKIYYLDMLDLYPELYTGNGRGHGLFSRNLDGSDHRLAYYIEDALLYDNGGGSGMLLTKVGWFYNVGKLEQDGTYHATAYLVDESGVKILRTEVFEEDRSYGVSNGTAFGGDLVFTNRLVGGNDLLRYEDGQFETVPIGDHLYDMGYLSGNVLRTFRENDGYYDIDLEKEEEVFLAEPRLKNSKALIALPNCIVETNIGWRTKAAEDPFAMEIFDGETWRAVKLPPEIMEAEGRPGCGILAVASDRILFHIIVNGTSMLYEVMLGEDELIMEFCGELR